MLQLDGALTKAMHVLGFEVAVETNGTLLPPEGVDWICCSPKAGGQLVLLLKTKKPGSGMLRALFIQCGCNNRHDSFGSVDRNTFPNAFLMLAKAPVLQGLLFC